MSKIPELSVKEVLEEVKEKVLKEGKFVPPHVDGKLVISYHRPIVGFFNMLLKKIFLKLFMSYYPQHIQKIVDQINEAIDALTNLAMRGIRGVKELNKLYNELHERLMRLERRLIYTGKVEKREYQFIPSKPDYFLFALRTRGPSEYLKEKYKRYVKYFLGKKNVIDIGCGRGEMLEVLRENNIPAKGIEIDEDMFLLCREKGLQVEKVDVFEYLSKVADNSLGGIFMGQVIEHFAPKEIVNLLALCEKKLEKDAYIVVETVNPETQSGLRWFYKDITHKTPLAPDTLKILLESQGFKIDKVEFLSPVGESERLKPLEVSDAPPEFRKIVESLNKNIKKLNNALFGYQEYVVIARK